MRYPSGVSRSGFGRAVKEFDATFVRNGVRIMTVFRKTEISDMDLADIDAYLLPL